METIHNGYKIIYDENSEKFVVDVGDQRLTSEKLSSLKQRLDKLEKSEKKFKRIDILCSDSWSRGVLNKATITSVHERGVGYSVQVWVTDSKKKRSSRSPWELYHYSNKNLGLYEEVKELQKQKKSIENKIDKTFKLMDLITEEDLRKASE